MLPMLDRINGAWELAASAAFLLQIVSVDALLLSGYVVPPMQPRTENAAALPTMILRSTSALTDTSSAAPEKPWAAVGQVPLNLNTLVVNSSSRERVSASATTVAVLPPQAPAFALREPLSARGLLQEQPHRLRLAKRVLPSQVPAEDSVERRIPRVIWQTIKGDGRRDKTSVWVERNRAEVMLTWVSINPTWEYRLLDDNDIEEYIRTEYGDKELATFRAINQGASKADFFRALVMYRHGGAYFDTDAILRPDAPLDLWVRPGAEFITGLCSWRPIFHQWGLLAANGSCVFEKLIDRMQKATATNDWPKEFRTLKVRAWDTATRAYELHYAEMDTAGRTETFGGPGAMQSAAMACIRNPETRHKFLRGLRLCPRDMFSGRVVAKAAILKGENSSWSDWQPIVIDPGASNVSSDRQPVVIDPGANDDGSSPARSLQRILPTPAPYEPKSEQIGPTAKDGYELCAPVRFV